MKNMKQWSWALLAAAMLLPVGLMAQTKTSVVKLKSGTEIKGVIKAIDPTDAVTIEVAGIETTIKMDQILRISEEENLKPAPTANSQTAINNVSGEEPLTEKLRVTDTSDYPESFDLKVDTCTVKMILVRGGDMNMGFDGRFSLSMKSEPIHRVHITSFYISEDYISSDLYQAIRSTMPNSSISAFKYKKTVWSVANDVVEKIAEISGQPVRMPTEAEWEYAACSPQQPLLFSNCKEMEFCSDFFGPFQAVDNVVDPTGPATGKYHVVRGFNSENGKFDRSEKPSKKCRIRLAMKAKDVVKK